MLSDKTVKGVKAHGWCDTLPSDRKQTAGYFEPGLKCTFQNHFIPWAFAHLDNEGITQL